MLIAPTRQEQPSGRNLRNPPSINGETEGARNGESPIAFRGRWNEGTNSTSAGREQKEKAAVGRRPKLVFEGAFPAQREDTYR
jgi:hypothetical protein